MCSQGSELAEHSLDQKPLTWIVALIFSLPFGELLQIFPQRFTATRRDTSSKQHFSFIRGTPNRDTINPLYITQQLVPPTELALACWGLELQLCSTHISKQAWGKLLGQRELLLKNLARLLQSSNRIAAVAVNPTLFPKNHPTYINIQNLETLRWRMTYSIFYSATVNKHLHSCLRHINIF